MSLNRHCLTGRLLPVVFSSILAMTGAMQVAHASDEHEGHEHHSMEHAEHSGHDHSSHEGHEGHEGHEHHDHSGHGGDDPHAAHKAMMNARPKAATTISMDLSDTTLVSSDGKEVKLKSDVIGDRIVVVDFVYTTCTTVCPVLSVIMRKIQDRMGDRMGSEVVMASISVDPVRDTPAKLKAYSKKHHASDNWYWLTGHKSSVEDVLKEMGAYTPSYEDHPAMVLVGDLTTGNWARFYGFPDPNAIINKIDAFAAAR